MYIDISSRLGEYEIKKLTEESAPELQKLYDDSSDYFSLIFGHPAKSDWGKSYFKELPKGKSLEDKYAFGIYIQNNLIGILDFIKDYPEESTWFIGLLLFHPNERGKGLGKKIFTLLCEKLREVGAKKVRISVADQNANALQFWKGLGFIEKDKSFQGISHITYFDYPL